ncbi:MAG: hypothetical protein ACLUOI_31595 [Eisenbergiella sp.]
MGSLLAACQMIRRNGGHEKSGEPENWAKESRFPDEQECRFRVFTGADADIAVARGISAENGSGNMEARETLERMQKSLQDWRLC